MKFKMRIQVFENENGRSFFLSRLWIGDEESVLNRAKEIGSFGYTHVINGIEEQLRIDYFPPHRVGRIEIERME